MKVTVSYLLLISTLACAAPLPKKASGNGRLVLDDPGRWRPFPSRIPRVEDDRASRTKQKRAANGILRAVKDVKYVKRQGPDGTNDYSFGGSNNQAPEGANAYGFGGSYSQAPRATGINSFGGSNYQVLEATSTGDFGPKATGTSGFDGSNNQDPGANTNWAPDPESEDPDNEVYNYWYVPVEDNDPEQPADDNFEVPSEEAVEDYTEEPSEFPAEDDLEKRSAEISADKSNGRQFLVAPGPAILPRPKRRSPIRPDPRPILRNPRFRAQPYPLNKRSASPEAKPRWYPRPSSGFTGGSISNEWRWTASPIDDKGSFVSDEAVSDDSTGVPEESTNSFSGQNLGKRASKRPKGWKWTKPVSVMTMKAEEPVPEPAGRPVELGVNVQRPEVVDGSGTTVW